mmetsp:Transcript_35492/g.56796  ORF Transcript_35492/g.56796 Transcript_35492/m.56796 type:complete len:454 (+) Transcript_35492:420-1781(+)
MKSGKFSRSSVYSRHGMVATSQPLASEIGLDILKRGGNCVDAAIAIAATLNVTEPCSTGIGGDAFLLFYDAKTRKVSSLNGSGRCAKGLTLAKAREGLPQLAKELPAHDVNCITVPGTAAAWCDAITKWGSMSMAQVLEPAIQLAEEGFPVSPITSFHWGGGEKLLKRGPNFAELCYYDEEDKIYRAPRAGEIMKNPSLASVFRELAQGGKEAFYQGRAGKEIVKIVREMGGVLSESDLRDHVTTFPDPIKVRYKDVDVYEVPPNGQGIAALMGLNMLESARLDGRGIDPKTQTHGDFAHLHYLIEIMRLAFADARAYVADPDVVAVPTQELLSPAYAKARESLIDPAKASADVQAGTPMAGSDTVSFQVVDNWGNAVSMVNSNYEGFGSGIIPKGCGFTLQNRGANFSLVEGHPNVLAPGKRPYHTIIPALMLHSDTDELFATFTCMVRVFS